MRDGVLKSGVAFGCSVRSVDQAAKHVAYSRAIPVRFSSTVPDLGGPVKPASLSLILSAPEGTLVGQESCAATFIAASRRAGLRSAA